MIIDTSHTLYFVEEGKRVSTKQGILKLPIYQQVVHKAEVLKILSCFGLRELHDFADMIQFDNERIKITMDLKSEDNFYDDDEERLPDVSLDEYVTLVNFLSIVIINRCQRQDIEIIREIMLKFRLGIYYIDTGEHYRNIEEVESLLKRLDLLEV